MIAKTNYEEINMILGHFICSVEGTELQPPRLGLNQQGWYSRWQVRHSRPSLCSTTVYGLPPG